MTDFFEKPLLGFDIESTGVSVWDDRIVTFSMVYSANSQSTPIILEWCIDPCMPIPEDASNVHGVTDEYVKEHGLDAKTALQEIADRFSPIVDQKIPRVAYNITFDATLLWEEFERHNIKLNFTKDQLFEHCIDPLVIDKAVDKYRKGSRKLTDTAAHYGYDLTNAHESTADVLATLHICRELKSFFKPEMTIEMLQEFQKDAKMEQSTSFQAYLRKKLDEEGNLVDPEAIISTEWPYQTKAG